MTNNTAFVAFLRNIQKIENADHIVSADVVLNGVKQTQVVVGVDTQENTKIVYFDSNLALSDVFIQDHPELATYLAKGNRVRTIKLKGIISNGLAVEIDKFKKYFGKDVIDVDMSEGFSFTELGGTAICKKWLPPVKMQSVSQDKKGRKGRTISRMIPGQFHFHVDTAHLLRNIHRLNKDSIISISRKIHGTSAIASNCLVKRPLNLMEKLAKILGVIIDDAAYDYIYSSRSVVKNDAPTTGFYKQDIWTKAGEDNFKNEDTFKKKLHQGETVYYEIVGYLPGTSSFIQKNYAYGCNEGEYKIAVYRITKTGLDGDVTEYSWSAMKERCREMNVPMVEEYEYGNLWAIYNNRTGWTLNGDDWREKFVGWLKSFYLEKDCADSVDSKGKKMPDEGIVLRIEGLGIEVYKLKSEKFLLKENQMKDEEVEDIEEKG